MVIVCVVIIVRIQEKNPVFFERALRTRISSLFSGDYKKIIFATHANNRKAKIPIV